MSRLPTNKAFYKDPVNYDRMFLLFYYIKTHYGESKLVELYRRSGSIEDPHKTTSAAAKDINTVLGVTQKQLLSSFNSWAKQNVRSA